MAQVFTCPVSFRSPNQHCQSRDEVLVSTFWSRDPSRSWSRRDRPNVLVSSWSQKPKVSVSDLWVWCTSEFRLYFHLKVTIIWAPQSETSAKGVHRGVRAPQARAVGGPTYGSGGASWVPPAAYGAEPRRRRFFVYTNKIWANFWSPMRKHIGAEKGK